MRVSRDRHKVRDRVGGRVLSAWCGSRTKRPADHRPGLDLARIAAFPGRMESQPHQTTDGARFAGRLGNQPHQGVRVSPISDRLDGLYSPKDGRP
jgi:hypothetical protein